MRAVPLRALPPRRTARSPPRADHSTALSKASESNHAEVVRVLREAMGQDAAEEEVLAAAHGYESSL